MKRSWFSRHPLCFMALYLILYLSAFNFLNTQIHMPHILVHCRLDDLIPFCEWFLIPYVFWYFLIVFTLLYLMLYCHIRSVLTLHIQPVPSILFFSSCCPPCTRKAIILHLQKERQKT